MYDEPKGEMYKEVTRVTQQVFEKKQPNSLLKRWQLMNKDIHPKEQEDREYLRAGRPLLVTFRIFCGVCMCERMFLYIKLCLGYIFVF